MAAVEKSVSFVRYWKRNDQVGGEEYEFVRAIVENCMPVASSPREIEEIEGCVRAANWERCTVPSYMFTSRTS